MTRFQSSIPWHNHSKLVLRDLRSRDRQQSTLITLPLVNVFTLIPTCHVFLPEFSCSSMRRFSKFSFCSLKRVNTDHCA